LFAVTVARGSSDHAALVTKYALELALAISKAYGVQLRSDDERNHRIFSSLRTLTAHIEKHRAR